MNSNMKKRSALGKGLSALLENADTDITTKSSASAGVVGSVSMLAIESIEANPFNPVSYTHLRAHETG
jgi:ParB family chromosome partitioning protein